MAAKKAAAAAEAAEAKKAPKAAKAAKAAAPAAEETVSERAAFRSKKIRLVKDGPGRREGSKAAERFAHYKNGITVGAWLEASGGTTGNVHKDVERGSIELYD